MGFLKDILTNRTFFFKLLKLVNILAILSRVFHSFFASLALEKVEFLFYSLSGFKDKLCFAFLAPLCETEEITSS